MITPPRAGEDSRELWRTVEMLEKLMGALENMTVFVEGNPRMIGRLEVREGACFLHIESGTELGN